MIRRLFCASAATRKTIMMTEVEIIAADGKAPAWFFASPQPTDAGILLYMDVFGIRPAWFEIGERMASLGYHVLLPDLYYRLGPYEPVNAAVALATPTLLAERRSMRDRTPMSLTDADVPYFIDALDRLGATGKIGVAGYCLGGGRAMRAANVMPDRIAAAASLHGGNLAIDDVESPHRHLDRMKARLYIGCAGVDFSFSPEQSGILAEALRKAGIDHQIENYVGCEHGWVLPDNPIHHVAGTERHWARLRMLFEETLRQA